MAFLALLYVYIFKCALNFRTRALKLELIKDGYSTLKEFQYYSPRPLIELAYTSVSYIGWKVGAKNKYFIFFKKKVNIILKNLFELKCPLWQKSYKVSWKGWFFWQFINFLLIFFFSTILILVHDTLLQRHNLLTSPVFNCDNFFYNNVLKNHQLIKTP